MSDVTTILKGRLEDEQGRVIHPATEADVVAMADGKNVEVRVAELLAMFAQYLPLNGGGTVTGPLNITGGRVDVNQWASISAGTDGFVLLGQNCYKGPTDNKYYYRSTHSDLGARGIVFRYGGNSGISWFDMGMVATVAGQEFTPTIKSLTRPDAELISFRDLNALTENGAYCGQGMTNTPNGSTDWFWIFVENLTDNSVNYVYQKAVAVNQQEMFFRTRRNGQWYNWERVTTSAHTIVSTSAPSSADGEDGDTWDVYV